eukprot:scaffold77494_cov18-Phaeocystis_antarctica.AAC.1
MARSHTGATLAFFRVCCGTRSGPSSCLWLRCVFAHLSVAARVHGLHQSLPCTSRRIRPGGGLRRAPVAPDLRLPHLRPLHVRPRRRSHKGRGR